MADGFDFAAILARFVIRGSLESAERHGRGHINDTFAIGVRLPDGEARRFILQRVNQQVFHQPVELMENIAAVTAHLRRKIVELGGDPERETLTVIAAHDGKPYWRDANGDFWRAYDFIEGAQTFQIPQSMEQVYQAGSAFARFQMMLVDFPADRLHPTIPDFHNTPRRLRALEAAVEQDLCARRNSVNAEIEFVHQRRALLSKLEDLAAVGALPQRVTHNDTKFNNVMVDDHSGRGICVVDLDTVMPGLVLYDYGDAIRSITNTAEEDEINLSKVDFSLEAFESYTCGYLHEIGRSLCSQELEQLVFSARLMTLECGMRFLTDHLQGDRYFRISRPNHNLDRCRTQFRLVERMEQRAADMEQIIAHQLEQIAVNGG